MQESLERGGPVPRDNSRNGGKGRERREGECFPKAGSSYLSICIHIYIYMYAYEYVNVCAGNKSRGNTGKSTRRYTQRG